MDLVFCLHFMIASDLYIWRVQANSMQPLTFECLYHFHSRQTTYHLSLVVQMCALLVSAYSTWSARMFIEVDEPMFANVQRWVCLKLTPAPVMFIHNCWMMCCDWLNLRRLKGLNIAMDYITTHHQSHCKHHTSDVIIQYKRTHV